MCVCVCVCVREREVVVSLTEANGVTLLALGNGAPDIFSAFAAINQSDDHKSSLAIGALFGTIAATGFLVYV